MLVSSTRLPDAYARLQKAASVLTVAEADFGLGRYRNVILLILFPSGRVLLDGGKPQMSTATNPEERTAPDQPSPSYTDEHGHLAVASMLTAVVSPDRSTDDRRSWSHDVADPGESVRLVGRLVAFGLLVALASCAVALAVIVTAPVAAAVAGSAGLLTTWVAGLGLLVTTPRVASRCLVIIRRAVYRRSRRFTDAP